MRKVCVGLLVLLTALLGLPATAATAGQLDPDNQQAVLPSGHCLVAEHDYALVELVSTSQRIHLDVDWQGFLQLNDQVQLPAGGGAGTPLWEVDPRNMQTRRTTLCMQRNGDLVLRRDGHVAWHSRTAGKAAHGYAQVLDRGSFVVRTTQHRTVWSSHTTGLLMVAGDRLTGGHALVNRSYPHSWTTLEMRRSGDLVLLRNSHVVWHTDTHTSGSYLLVTTSGRIDVLNPHHQVIWRSRAVGRHAVFSVAQRGRITLGNVLDQRCWVRPVGANPDCGVG